MTVDLDDLTYLQLLGKCHREDLPSKGERSVLQKTIEDFIGGGEKNSGKPEHEDRAFLREHGLNVSGGEKEWAARRLLYKGGKHDMACSQHGAHSAQHLRGALCNGGVGIAQDGA
eukprot:3150509-Rhodomonas_salina.1